MVECVGADQLDRAAKVLREGGLVAFATETVYGLGANALDASAVARVFEVKGRPKFDPLIVHVADIDAARRLAKQWPAAAQRLAEAFWPGPMTLVVEKHAPAPSPSSRKPQAASPTIPDLVTAGLPTVALRVPGHELARELVRRAGVPVAAPSANRFGGVSPTRAAHVVAELGDAVDLVLDGGPCETGLESTVVSVVGEAGDALSGNALPDNALPGAAHGRESVGVRRDAVTVLRLGGLAVERIEAVVGPVEVARGRAEADTNTAAAAGLASPGMLLRHYAPRARLVVVDRVEPTQPELVAAMEAGGPSEPGRAGVLLFSDEAGVGEAWRTRGAAVRVLSPGGDLIEAAANLFAALRELDAAGVTLIVAERAPERGLGRAINDRLRRAAAPEPGASS